MLEEDIEFQRSFLQQFNKFHNKGIKDFITNKNAQNTSLEPKSSMEEEDMDSQCLDDNCEEDGGEQENKDYEMEKEIVSKPKLHDLKLWELIEMKKTVDELYSKEVSYKAAKNELSELSFKGATSQAKTAIIKEHLERFKRSEIGNHENGGWKQDTTTFKDILTCTKNS